MAGRGKKMRKKYLSFTGHPSHWLCSLYHWSITGSQQAADQQWCCPCFAACLCCQRGGWGWSISYQFVNWWCWSFMMRRLPLPSPCFWQPTVLLLFLLICSIRHVHVLRVASLLLWHSALCIFTLYPILLCLLPRMFEVPVSRITAKFSSQHLFPALSRCCNFGASKDKTFLCFSETQISWSTDMIAEVLI